MKIAREITEHISPFLRPTMTVDGLPVRDHVEKLIAARLEPVWKVLCDSIMACKSFKDEEDWSGVVNYVADAMQVLHMFEVE